MTVFINNYGEQYVDIVALIVLWTISLVGLYYFFSKEAPATHLEKNDIIGKTVIDEQGVYLGILQGSLRDQHTGSVTDILVEPSSALDQYFGTRDAEGKLVFPSDSIKSVEDIVVIKK